MQLVIDIPEEMYQTIKETNVVISGRRSGRRFDYILFDAVSTGAPLPKGHGRLIDADELIKQLEVMANDEWNKQVGSSKGLEEVIDIVDDISPIIEADKAEGSGE